MKEVILVGTGGFAGSIARYLLGKLSMHIQSQTLFPPTWLINIIGCFLIGIFVSLGSNGKMNNQLQLLLSVGFCGGFTTFSSFSVENLLLLETGKTGLFFFYAVSSVLLGLFAVWLGIKVIELF